MKIEHVQTLYFPATNPAKDRAMVCGELPEKPGDSTFVLGQGQTLIFVERQNAKTFSFENSEGYDMFSVTKLLIKNNHYDSGEISK